MFKIKLALFLMILWITAGCQQAYIGSASNEYNKLQTPSLEKQRPDNLPVLSDSKNNNRVVVDLKEPENRKETSAISNPVSPDSGKTNLLSTGIKKESYKQNKESDKTFQLSALTAQEKIDQALELCDYAQEMWEKGKLEEAITNLDSAYSTILEIESETHSEFNQQKEDIRYLISKRILEIYASRQIVVNGLHNEIPITLNKHVQNEIKRLTGPERKFFIKALERSEKFRPFITSELKKAGLPEEISWLPLIESGFKIRALSPARALGLWQFIPSTGYKFGLSRNYYIDERLDPHKSTMAAISYLKELHNLFGDWTTALAAYNCGEGRVLRTIRKQSINYLDNFWDLYQNLPRETARYVPRFLATLHIVNNLDNYNMKIDVPLLPVAFKTYEIKKQIRLKDIAKEIGVKEAVLKDLNPELRYGILPPESYQLKIPEGKTQIFLSKIDKIKTANPNLPKFVFHRIRRGDTLSGLAKKYKTSVRAISASNHIYKSHKIIVGKVLKIPSKTNTANVHAAVSRPVVTGHRLTYYVKSGDNLWNIARKFNTTTKSIIAINKLSTTALSIGQVLKVTSEKQSKIAKKGTSTYKVRSGDSPFLIAKKYNMKLNRLLVLNHLNKKSKIFPGQKLIVE
ncbi:MAG: LysM peptidoglycan-binding domain-containing protein [Desulfobacterales bacterium]|uniref:lytic transglycosylase domain-containing protein n=1 Tax=Desulfobacula sp. TaxID=2593537 RepID=UPI001D9E70B6|nr:LysM peptidoglycan-binding domain-containing protein [Desulfobacula sp.]MBT4509222.1 LysM peptidoglycan-binding domain-containing protein [Desulfobacula sp.]MBT7696799.1 LysM peptidoglycan-binding domain-containing protein [Desulfobacterales bacterium]